MLLLIIKSNDFITAQISCFLKVSKKKPMRDITSNLPPMGRHCIYFTFILVQMNTVFSFNLSFSVLL
jgi:hypothetical protein